MNIFLKTTAWFIRKFPEIGVLISILSFIIPLVLTLFFEFPTSIMMWAIYTEIVIIPVILISFSIKFTILFFIAFKHKNKKKRTKVKDVYKSLKFTLF